MTATKSPRVGKAWPRRTAQVRFKDGRIFAAPRNTELRHFVDAAGAEKPWPFPIVAALIDNELRELTYHIDRDVEVIPLGTDDRDGSRIYRRSLTFLLVVAAHDLFPQVVVNVDHAVTFGGYYCEVKGRPQFTTEELAAIEARMAEIVASDANVGEATMSPRPPFPATATSGTPETSRTVPSGERSFSAPVRSVMASRSVPGRNSMAHGLE